MKEFWDEFLEWGKSDGVTLAKSITFIILGYIIIKIIIGSLKRSVNKSKLEKTLPNFLISILNIVLMIALVIFVLRLFGVSTDSVVTIASVFSLGISLALQDVLSGFANGIILVTTKPLAEGEYVSVGDAEGTVVKITMLHTVLKTADGLMLTLPNTSITSSNVKNFSRLPIRRIAIDVPVAYGSKTEQIKELVMAVVDSHPKILHDPAPSVRLTEYGDSNLVYTLKAWVTGDNYWDVRFDLYEQILDVLVENKISIDYNQVDVHIKEMPQAIEEASKPKATKAKSTTTKKTKKEAK